MKKIRNAMVAIAMVSLLSLTVYQAKSACQDDPNNRNAGTCVPSLGGQACEPQRGSCNCFCDVPIA